MDNYDSKSNFIYRKFMSLVDSLWVNIPSCYFSDLSLIPNNNNFNFVLTVLIRFKIRLLFLTLIDKIWCVNKYYIFFEGRCTTVVSILACHPSYYASEVIVVHW